VIALRHPVVDVVVAAAAVVEVVVTASSVASLVIWLAIAMSDNTYNLLIHN